MYRCVGTLHPARRNDSEEPERRPPPGKGDEHIEYTETLFRNTQAIQIHTIGTHAAPLAGNVRRPEALVAVGADLGEVAARTIFGRIECLLTEIGDFIMFADP